MSNWSLSVQVRENNPDHHFFNNHGTWWCHFWTIANGIRQKLLSVNLQTEVQRIFGPVSFHFS